MAAPLSASNGRSVRGLTDELMLLQLRSVGLFSGCDDAALALVAAMSGERRYRTGDTLVAAGTRVREVPIVLDGYAGAEIEGVPTVVLGPGAVIGGPEALDGALHPWTVVAQTAMVARVVSAPDFATLLASAPPLAISMIRQLGGRTRTVLDELVCARQGSVTPGVGLVPGHGVRPSSRAARPARS